MVKTASNHHPVDKKESTTKKSGAKKKTVITGIWPCKINGCNKQFAREADLKRHQRTTKVHSMPGFACPQCDAAFTRTDALRRHQKSRHNGVVIEPTDRPTQDGVDDETRSSGSRNSRSMSPSQKDRDRASQPRTNPVGPSSYYRQHTAMTTPYVPSRPPIVNPPYGPIALPTSATRMNVQTTWPYPPAWPDGVPPPPPMHSIPYPPPMYYPNTSHYRTNDNKPPSLSSQDQDNRDISGQETRPDSEDAASGAHTDEATRSTTETRPSHSEPAIDPALSGSTEFIVEIAQAALKAVIEAEASKSRDGSTSPQRLEERTEKRQTSDNDPAVLENGEVDETTELKHKEPILEHMLTEDGEPMLNPAELLTQVSRPEGDTSKSMKNLTRRPLIQESLASPPPS